MTSTPPDKHEPLSQRRDLLVARAAEQRQALAMQTRLLAAPLARVNERVHSLGNLKPSPAWLVGAVIAIVLIKPRRLAAVVRLARKATRAWKMVAPVVTPVVARMRH